MACLISETSASDGDIFPNYFREAGLGLIGKRTWGGVVGGGNIGLVDGGAVFVPRSATNDANGEYIIEGIGVPPDIDVENDPASVIAGRDPQLERGVAEVLEAIRRAPKSLPSRPADPVKTPKRRAAIAGSPPRSGARRPPPRPGSGPAAAARPPALPAPRVEISPAGSPVSGSWANGWTSCLR